MYKDINTHWILPPDPHGMNEQRAEWAGKALEVYNASVELNKYRPGLALRAALDWFQKETGCEPAEALTDLLCNVMHWLDRNVGPGWNGNGWDSVKYAAMKPMLHQVFFGHPNNYLDAWRTAHKCYLEEIGGRTIELVNEEKLDPMKAFVRKVAEISGYWINEDDQEAELKEQMNELIDTARRLIKESEG